MSAWSHLGLEPRQIDTLIDVGSEREPSAAHQLLIHLSLGQFYCKCKTVKHAIQMKMLAYMVINVCVRVSVCFYLSFQIRKEKWCAF